MCAAIPAKPGGAYIHMQDVAISLRKYGFKVEIMTNLPLENRLRPGFLLYYISPYLITAKIIFRLLSGYKIKAVEIHEPSAYFYCILRRIFRFLPLCFVKSYGVEESVFEICSAYMNFSFKTKILQRLRNLLNFIALKYSEFNILEIYKDKYLLEKRFKIFNNIITGCSLSPDLFQKARKEEHKGINVAFIGGWIDIKGAQAMEEIIPQVLSRNNNICFYLLGTGIKNKKNVEDKFARYKDRVIIVAQYDHILDLPSYLNRCDILLAPSIYDSGSHAILEGLYFKLAVICSKNCFIYTMKQALENEEAIISFAPDDIPAYVNNILDLANDEAKRMRIANKGYEILKEFTWDRILVPYIEALRKL